MGERRRNRASGQLGDGCGEVARGPVHTVMGLPGGSDHYQLLSGRRVKRTVSDDRLKLTGTF